MKKKSLNNPAEQLEAKMASDSLFMQVDSNLSIINRLGIPTSSTDDLNASVTATDTAKLIYNSTLQKLRIYNPLTDSWTDANPANLADYYTKEQIDSLLSALSSVTPLTFNSGIRVKDGVVQLGLDTTTFGTTNVGKLEGPTTFLLRGPNGDVSSSAVSDGIVNSVINTPKYQLDSGIGLTPGKDQAFARLSISNLINSEKSAGFRASASANYSSTEMFAGKKGFSVMRGHEQREMNVFKVFDSDNAKGMVYEADYSLEGKADNRWIPDWGTVKAEVADMEKKSNKVNDFSVANHTTYPTTQAAKAYADSLVVGLLNDRGSYDASSNAYPTTGGSGPSGQIMKGNIWAISSPGSLGGVSVGIGDWVRALINYPGQSTSYWSIAEGNFGIVPENVTNKQKDLTYDIQNTKYPTVNAVNAGLAAKASLHGNDVLSGTKTFSSAAGLAVDDGIYLKERSWPNNTSLGGSYNILGAGQKSLYFTDYKNGCVARLNFNNLTNTGGTIRDIKFQNADGTVAYLADIPVLPDLSHLTNKDYVDAKTSGSAKLAGGNIFSGTQMFSVDGTNSMPRVHINAASDGAGLAVVGSSKCSASLGAFVRGDGFPSLGLSNPTYNTYLSLQANANMKLNAIIELPATSGTIALTQTFVVVNPEPEQQLYMTNPAIFKVTGSTSSLVFPPLVAATHSEVLVLNRGTGILTLKSYSGGNEIDNAGVAIATLAMPAGTSYRFFNDGTQWILLK